MLAQCPFCLEELGAQNTPVAMPCGHMYCLDCATFWFNQDDSPQKCTCGRMFKGEEIIRLWTSARTSAKAAHPASPSGAPRRDYGSQGRDVLAACHAAVTELEAGRQGSALATALSKTQLYVDSVAAADQSAATQTLLDSLRTVLSEIKKILQHSARTQHPSADDDYQRTAAREIRQVKAKMARDIQEIYHQNLLQEENARRELAEHEGREHELHQKLQDARRALETVRRNLEASRLKEAALEEEVDKLRQGELRYKKKYYALKQEVHAMRRSTSLRTANTDFEDDSLLVV